VSEQGVRYRYIGSTATRYDRIGAANGMLAFTGTGTLGVSYIPMSLDWIEVWVPE